jgi:hypothetical protein
MAVGAEVAQAQPASVVTAVMRTEVHRSVNHTRASVGSGHGVRPSGWRRWGMVGLVFTCSARRTLGETRKGFGLARALAFKPGGYGFRWLLRGDRTAAWPDIVQHEA